MDRALGRPVGPEVVRADSSGHLPGDLTNRGSSAFDGDPKTVWSTGFGDQVGSWVQVRSPRVVTASSIGLDVLADGRHSVPTRVHLEVDGRAQPSLALPPVPDGAAENATSHVTLRFPAVTGRTFKLVIDDVRTVQTQDYLSRHPVAMPTGFAEVDIAGLRVPPLPANGAVDLPHRPADGERQAGRGFGVGVDVRRAQAGGPGRLAVRREPPSPCAPGTPT